MSITQDGRGLPVLMAALYEYMISTDLTSNSAIENDACMHQKRSFVLLRPSKYVHRSPLPR